MSKTTPSPENPGPEGRGSSIASRLRRIMTRRGVVLMSLLGGALLLISSTMTWVHAYGLGSTSTVQEVAITGAELVETVTAMGLVGLAAGVAVTIAKRLGRVVIGSVLFGAAVIALLAIRSVLADPANAASAALGDITGTTADAARYELSMAVWLGFIGALLLLIASLALLVVSHRWPDRKSRRYQVSTAEDGAQGQLDGDAPDGGAVEAGREGTSQTPAAKRGDGGPESGPDEFDLWDGLSDGQDPTDPRR
ncbi:Trp biosynthesis-associated membrane protein [Nesterenkonia sp. LB17]|uniref:Trp biosynthesis-associated membrane protein n=1 Tax=Nesterenkonia sp. LB17 TaxID=2901230 RepID=UPI001F4CCF43|nr:Trp biosynthesis-associated membrane protein [Nesterenkonia sp. LB17]MCH8564808.1 Trp biosynthesis-associated membrane protein [Nesterenkonia sp. LB17]